MNCNAANSIWSGYDPFSYFPPIEEYGMPVAEDPTHFTGLSLNEEQAIPQDSLACASNALPTASLDAHMADVQDDRLEHMPLNER